MIDLMFDILAKGGRSASSDDGNNPAGMIFGILVVVIWIIGGIMSVMRKKSAQAPQEYVQQDWSHLLRNLTEGQSRPNQPGSTTPPPLPPLPMAPPPQQSINRQRMQQQQQSQQRPFVQQ